MLVAIMYRIACSYADGQMTPRTTCQRHCAKLSAGGLLEAHDVAGSDRMSPGLQYGPLPHQLEDPPNKRPEHGHEEYLQGHLYDSTRSAHPGGRYPYRAHDQFE